MVRIPFGSHDFYKRDSNLDEATEEQTNSSLTTNEIIEDAQSTQGDLYAPG